MEICENRLEFFTNAVTAYQAINNYIVYSLKDAIIKENDF